MSKSATSGRWKTEIGSLLRKDKISAGEIALVKKQLTNEGFAYGDWLSALLQQSEPGDLLSRIGLPIWKTLLSGLSQGMPQSIEAFARAFIDRTRFDLIKIRPKDLEAWCDLLISSGVVTCIQQIHPVKGSHDLVNWIGPMARADRDACSALLRVINEIAPLVKKQGAPLVLGNVPRERVLIDVGLLDLCLRLNLSVEIEPGERAFHFNCLRAPDERELTPSELERAYHLATSHPTYGQEICSAFLDDMRRNREIELLRRVCQYPVLRNLLCEHARSQIDRLSKADLRSMCLMLECIVRKTLLVLVDHEPSLLDALRTINFADLLQRSLHAGVFDEIGFPSLDEAVDRYRFKAPHGKWHQLYFYSFPYISFVQNETIVICGPANVATAKLPAGFHLMNVLLIMPIGSDVLLIHNDNSFQYQFKVITAKPLATWISKPNDSKRLRPPGAIGRSAITIQVDNDLWSIGAKPFEPGELPVGFPSDDVYSQDRKVWRMNTSATPAGSSTTPADRLLGYDVVQGKKFKSELPKFFEAHLIAGATPFFDDSHLLPTPQELESTMLGTFDGMLGFFVQGNTNGIVEAIGIDGRMTTRQLANNERGYPQIDIPLCMMNKPGSDGYWTFVRRFRSVCIVDESSGDTIANIDSASRDIPGQPCVAPHPIFWHLYSVRCPETSRALRSINAKAAGTLLEAARSEATVDFIKGDWNAPVKRLTATRNAVTSEFPAAPPRLVSGIAATCSLAAALEKAIHELIESVTGG